MNRALALLLCILGVWLTIAAGAVGFAIAIAGYLGLRRARRSEAAPS